MTRLANRLLGRAFKEADDHLHYEVPWDVHDGGEPLVDIADRDALFEAMEER